MAKERPPLEEMTLRQLRKVAAEFEVSRYSRMRKSQLLSAIQVAMMAANVVPNRLNSNSEIKEIVEATKFDLGSEEPTSAVLSAVDEPLGDLPLGYGESRIVIMPRDPQWGYVYWDIPNSAKESLRHQGGQQLALRLYDVTDIDINTQAPNNVQEYHCDELAREWYLPIPISDRDYVVEIGYRCADGRWLTLARSANVHIPPTYPSDWVEDHFITVPWEKNLNGQTLFTLVPPSRKKVEATQSPSVGDALYDEIFNMARSVEAQRVAGSLYGSMQMSGAGIESLSSHVFPSGAGLLAAGALSASGINYSGIGMSGAGLFSGSISSRPRQFWLVADAELIVYGATEPDANVTIGGRPIKLSPDGTFRHHMSFQDGIVDYPIFAVAADGEQNRSIHLKFERQTLERRTNTKEEAIPEWIS
ncbi:DUF4912 domain-containing protein [Tumidithrix elongata RA019]|uniref:DUF4912 domain-containing protein n=1 Tax=Tumidithrix elongata BACA0141 TaxID=2716417 RepID=A0AAW9PPV6_9CYAN|nr:DUF4912 domain-containing protein [Tumidithrix elongata RA019]